MVNSARQPRSVDHGRNDRARVTMRWWDDTGQTAVKVVLLRLGCRKSIWLVVAWFDVLLTAS